MEKVDLGHGLSVHVVQVTPERAEKWLKKNSEDNRNIQWGRVTSYANDMRAGNWELNHQGICFDGDGNLIDGQHRLHAIVEAKTPVLTLVFYDMNAGVQDSLDRGMSRSLAFLNQATPKLIAAVNTLRMLEQGAATTVPMTSAEASAIIERHNSSILVAKRIPNVSKMHGGAYGAILYAIPIDEDLVVEFATKVITGEMIRRGDPAFALRNFFERNERIPSWSLAMATLNCIAHHLKRRALSNVFTGEHGYRVLTSRRRALRIQNTPSAEIVPPPGGKD